MRKGMTLSMIAGFVMLGATSAAALDDAQWRAANDATGRGIAYLRTTQNQDGSWSPQPGPAITALVVSAMLDRPDISPNDPQVAKAIDYILSKVQPDGGIYDGILPNYNTAICLSALSKISNRPDVADAIANAQAYLQGLQWHGQEDPTGKPVDESHPFYGGAGYGDHGRPDLSNTQIMLQGLYDSGLDCNDPVFQRAVIFISRLQGAPTNDMFGPDIIEQDGGFIYSSSINKELIGVPESKANPEMMDEAENGAPVSGLRTYGSMTYAGFKSLLYANLDRDDPRVTAAYGWIQNNYTLDKNPGLPDNVNQQGLFYYYMTFARALRAWGATTITTTDGQSHDWSGELVETLTAKQRDDGSWQNTADRWMESDPNLVTAYALIALQNATR